MSTMTKGVARPKLKHIKLVLRGLPSALTEQELKEQLGNIPEHNYFRFVRPNPHLDYVSHSYLAISFPNETDVMQFSERFTGFLFVDSNGNSAPGLVELAPNTEVPRYKRENVVKDMEINKTENSNEYKGFLQKMEEHEPRLTIDEQLKRVLEKQTKGGEKIEVTPLAKYLLLQQIEKKDRLEDKRKEREVERKSRHLMKETRLKAEREQNKEEVVEKKTEGKRDDDGRKKGRKLLEFAKGEKEERVKKPPPKREEKKEERPKKEKEVKEKHLSVNELFQGVPKDVKPSTAKPDKKVREERGAKTDKVRTFTRTTPSNKPSGEKKKTEREIYRPGRMRKSKEQGESATNGDT